MSTGMFIGWSSPVSPEHDAAFNTWYDEVHLPQVRKAMPSVLSVRRFTVLGSGADGGVKRYVACYELADGDAAGAAAALATAAADGVFDMSPAMDRASTEMQFLVPYGD
jgi:hypothetical protein